MHKQYKKLKFSIFFLGLLVILLPQYGFAQSNPNLTIQDIVRFYFADTPVMIDIARCETGFRQYNPDGSALHDASGTYIGVFQISELIHTPRALSLGFNLATIDGNIGYARYLYGTSGTNPWKGCVPSTEVPATSIPPAATTPAPAPVTAPAATSSVFTSNLRMGMTNSQVLTMQQVLNKNGFTIALSGVGSVGQETNYFGSLTREALKKFQCAKQIVCDGNEATTGYGRVGPNTRTALNQL